MKGNRITTLLAAGILICGVSAPGSLTASNLTRGLELDLARFTGFWHELGRTPNKFQDNSLKKGDKYFSACYNASAHYLLEGPDRLRLENSCLRRSRQGTVIRDRMSAVAVPKKGSGGRELLVAFGRGVSRTLQRMFTGGGVGFRVSCVGPVNKDGLYDWAVISAARRTAVFLLTRHRKIPGNERGRMLACARKAGLPVHNLIYRQH